MLLLLKIQPFSMSTILNATCFFRLDVPFTAGKSFKVRRNPWSASTRASSTSVWRTSSGKSTVNATTTCCFTTTPSYAQPKPCQPQGQRQVRRPQRLRRRWRERLTDRPTGTPWKGRGIVERRGLFFFSGSELAVPQTTFSRERATLRASSSDRASRPSLRRLQRRAPKPP